MKQISFYALLSAGLLFLSSCIWGSGDKTDSLLIAKSAIDLKEKKKRERSESNSSDCKDESGCDDICEDVYNEDDDEENEGYVDTCLDLTYKRVIAFERILEILKEPYYSDLLNIEAKDFESFLEVSVGPWVENTKRLNNREVKDLLKWIAGESKISSAVKSAYSDKKEDFDLYEGMQRLFTQIAPKLTKYKGTSKVQRATKKCAELCSAVNKSTLAQSQSFWEMTSDNSDGRDIACKILKVECKDKDSPATLANIQVADCPAAVKTACELE